MASSVSFFSQSQLLKNSSTECPNKVILNELSTLPFIATYIPSGKTFAVCEKLLKQMRNWTHVFTEPLTAHQFDPMSLYWRPFSSSIDVERLRSQLESTMAYREMFLTFAFREGNSQILRYVMRHLIGIDLWTNAMIKLLDQKGELNLNTLEALLDSLFESHLPRLTQEKAPSFEKEHMENLVRAAQENNLNDVKNLLWIDLQSTSGEIKTVPISTTTIYKVIKACIQDTSKSTETKTIKLLLDRLVNIYLVASVEFSEDLINDIRLTNSKYHSFIPRLIDGIVNTRLYAEAKNSNDRDSVTIHQVQDENFVNLLHQGCCLHTFHPLQEPLENLKTIHANMLNDALETGNIDMVRKLSKKKIADLEFWTTFILNLLSQNKELNFERIKAIENSLKTIQSSLPEENKMAFAKIKNIIDPLKTCIANRDVIGVKICLEKMANICLQEFALALSTSVSDL